LKYPFVKKKLFGLSNQFAARGHVDRRIARILGSGLFDVNWYRETARLHSANEEEVIRHYIAQGDEKRLPPHPLFDVDWYAINNPDLKKYGLTELEHFLEIGEARRASPSPLFDTVWYVEQSGGKLPRGESPFKHFLHKGGAQCISPHPLFDSKFYISQDQRLSGSGVNPLTHFVGCGAIEGRNPNPFFDVGWYISNYRNQFGSKTANPLAHFIAYGAENGLAPHPAIDLDRYAARNSLKGGRLEAYISLVKADDRSLVDGPTEAEHTESSRDVGAEVSWVDLTDFNISLDAEDHAPIGEADSKLFSPSIAADTQLVSFDIWDTVLRRNCHPDEIKLQSARYLYVKGYFDIKPAFRDIRDLYFARVSCENKSSPNDEFEFRFENAVSAWLDLVVSQTLLPSQKEALRKELIDHELGAEKRATRLDSAMLKVLRSLRKPAIFASDFYLSGKAIRELLAHHQAQGFFVGGFVSSDSYETKRSGKLFDKILDEHELKAPELLHIGDNEHADIEVPHKKGIKTALFTDSNESRLRTWWGTAFDARLKGDASVHERRILALLEGFVADRKLMPDSMAAVGVRVAPLVFGYVLSIIQDAIRNKIDAVHYFTREGIFFQQVHDAIASADPLGVSYPRSEILEVSRRATFAASLSECSPAALMRLWTLYSRQSIKGLAVSLNLDEVEVESLAKRAGLKYSATIVYPWRDKKFLAFLNSADFQKLATNSIGKQRAGLAAYLKGKGVYNADTLVISDIGWRGTIQDNLAHLLPKTFIRGHYVGLFSFLNDQPSNTVKTGWAFDEPNTRACRIGDVAPLEMLFNGIGGSVVGYEMDSVQSATAKRVVHEEEDRVVAGPVAEFQRGVIAAIRPLADYVRLHGLVAEDLRRLSEVLAATLSKNPPTCIADAFQQLHHNETFGTGDVEVVASAETMGDLLKRCQGSELHGAATQMLADVRWPEGAVRSSDLHSWWHTASPSTRISVPVTISEAFSPAIIRARGSKLAVFAPSPIRSSGGHRTIFNVVKRLAKIGLEPMIFLEGVGAGVDVVEDYLSGVKASIHTMWHSHIPSDVALATIAHSAQFVAEYRTTHLRNYLVQDYEALFNPMSDGFIYAENSYTQGLHHLTIGNWLSHVIQTRFGASATPAGLGVDTSVYKADKKDGSGRELAICFLYQPDKPRRTSRLGIEAIRLVKQKIPEVKVYVYGSDIPVHLDFEVENLGLVGDLSVLNALYNKCTVGLCVSGSNPSRIPYEMMAAGCVPVDLYRYNNLLDHKAEAILLAYQNPESIAKALLQILENPDLAAKMSGIGQKFMASRTLDWEVDVVSNAILAQLDGTLPEFSSPDLLYSHAPIIAEGGNQRAMKQFCSAEFNMATARVGAGQ
jgi:O-antigen biosynthesis protein